MLVAAFVSMAAPLPGSNAERVLDRLKQTANSQNYYWAWTHPWMTIWKRSGDARFAVKTERGFAPKPTAEVTLSSDYSKYADGKRCVIGYSDFYAVTGTWWGDKYYAANRATLTAAIKRHWHELGGITVFSWHMDHPYCTNGFEKASYRFKSYGADRNVIRQILDGTGGPCGMDSVEGKNYRQPYPNPRAWYMAALRNIADFFNGLVDEETGEKIPVVMRYGHEMEGTWFWWGRTWCTPEEFRAFCRMTADYLRTACGDGQILFAYTPDRFWHDLGNEGDTENTYLAYYPGDKYVDIVGFDDYSIARGRDNDAKVEENLNETVRKLRLISSFAKERGKVAALTETGGENKRDDFWVYLHRIMTAEGVHCAFVDTWSDRYGTIPATPESEKDELEFSRRPEVLMATPETGFRVSPKSSAAKDGCSPDVMVVYYPHWHRYPKGDEWFGAEKWKEGEWAFVKTPKTRFKGQINFRPLAGYLNGADPEHVETEIALASNAGINVFLYDYYWYNGEKTQEEAIEKGFLKAKNRSAMKFALMWCYHERRDAFRPPYSKERRELMSLAHTPEEFLGLIDYSIAHYFNQPEYYRKDGRLFFSIYKFSYLWEKWGKDDGKVRDAILEARRRVRSAGLGELHINVQGIPTGMMKQMAALGIDSFTDYGFNAYAVKNFYARFKAGEACFDYGEIDGLLQDSWAKKRKASPIPYFPIVPTGWDATLRCRFDVPFPWNGDAIYPYCGTFTNNTDAIFEKYLRDAKAFAMSDPEKKGIVYINAWNEYTEGCWLLPDVRRGDLKLRAVARVFGRRPSDKYAFTRNCPYWEGSKAPVQKAKFTDVPDFENVKYGPHERQGMDVWLPKCKASAKGGTPAVIVFHGGGWTSGDRLADAAVLLKDCQARGIALVTVGYRFLADANDQDVKPPVKACLDDAVAAVRCVKAHASEWNIDVSRIGLTGGSAGGCSSLYCSLMDGNVLGIRAVLANSPQTTLDPKEMKEWIPNSRYGARAFGYKDFNQWLEHRSECLDQIERYSPAALLRKCPSGRAARFFYTCPPLPPPGELPKDPTHAAMFCVKFEELCKAKGVFCRQGTRKDFFEFLLEK